MNRKLQAFVVLVGLLVSLQFLALVTEGVSRQTLVVVSELIIFACFGLVLRHRRQLAAWTGRLPGPPWARFLLLAWTSGMVAETAYIFSEPIHPDLLVDWLLTTPWYLMWFALWWWVLNRFAYSVTELFFLGGIHGFLVEAVFSGAILRAHPIEGVLTLVGVVAVYGAFFTPPGLLMKDELHGKLTTWRRWPAAFAPLLAYVPGVAWALGVASVFGWSG